MFFSNVYTIPYCHSSTILIICHEFWDYCRIQGFQTAGGGAPRVDAQGSICTFLPHSNPSARQRDRFYQEKYRETLDQQVAMDLLQKSPTGAVQDTVVSLEVSEHEPIFPNQRYPLRHSDVVDPKSNGYHLESLCKISKQTVPRRNRTKPREFEGNPSSSKCFYMGDGNTIPRK